MIIVSYYKLLLAQLAQYYLFEMTTVPSDQGPLLLVIGSGKFMLCIEFLFWIVFYSCCLCCFGNNNSIDGNDCNNSYCLSKNITRPRL